MRIAIVDTAYPEFLKTLPLIKGQRSYDAELRAYMAHYFGTHTGYSAALKMLNHECIDIIANHQGLQNLWAIENDCEILCGSNHLITLDQIEKFRPDVVFCQDLSFFSTFEISMLRSKYILAAQCSCRIDDEKLKQFDVVFSSFPFYIPRLEALGVKGVFLPLAFDPVVIERAVVPVARTQVSFVGGYGQHWETDELFTVLAERTPIQFWGYGFEKAPKVIQDCWRGPAWGLDMYEIYLRSHIVLNRHGGISQGYANNLRMFEATGCGALLMTEYAPNLWDYFESWGECASYETPEDCAASINQLLEDPSGMREIASAGQQRTLKEHTYYQRMPIVAKTLQECLDRKQVSA